jgi:hypothetical protein
MRPYGPDPGAIRDYRDALLRPPPPAPLDLAAIRALWEDDPSAVDLPALLAEVARLRAVLFETQVWVEHSADCASWQAGRCTCEAGPMLTRIYAALEGTP